LLDSDFTTTNDLDGMVLWIAARKNRRITEFAKVTAGESIDVTGGSVVAVVTNTNRGAMGASLSQRPALCLGTVAEVAACKNSLLGIDAGVDAGTAEVPDAGMPTADAGTQEPPPPAGCGCGMGTTPLWFLLALIARRRQVH
jgi:hypothetical protein